ncbi:MAG: hypothetical protein AAF517_13645 [Planctomycetota bacterium]
MRNKARRALTFVALAGVFACLAGALFIPNLQRYIAETFIDADELLQDTPWVWENQSAKQYFAKLAPVTVRHTVKDSMEWEIELSYGSRPKIQLKGHERSALIVTRDGRRLIFADYRVMVNGCTLASYDLFTGKKLWSTALRGVGRVGHSRWRNAVQLRQDHRNFVTVFGDESTGRYVEIVDLRTGETAAHRNEPKPRLQRLRRTLKSRSLKRFKRTPAVRTASTAPASLQGSRRWS